MQHEQRILKNTAVLGAGEAVGQVAGFVFVVVCGRAYGRGVLGWYAAGMALGAVATVLVSAGTRGMLLRDLAQRPEESARRVAGTLPYQLALSVLVLAVLGALSFTFVRSAAGRWIILSLGLSQVTLAAASLLLIPLRARQIMWPGALAGAAYRTVVVLAAVALIMLGAPSGPVFAAFPATAILITVVVFVTVRRFLGGRLERGINSFAEQRALYTAALPFFGSAVLDTVYGRVGLLLLILIAGAESAGVYTAADRLLVVVSVFRVLFTAALYPAVAHLAVADRPRGIELSNRCMRLILVFTVPAAGLMAIFHKEIIALTFGPSFARAGAVLLLLAPALVIRGINGLWTTQALAVGLQGAVFRVHGLMVAMFAATSIVLIPVAGPRGLVAALLLAEAVYAIGLRALLSTDGFRARVLPLLPKPLAAIAAGTLVYFPLEAAALPLRAAAVVAAMVATLFLTGAVRVHDLKYLQSILSDNTMS